MMNRYPLLVLGTLAVLVFSPASPADEPAVEEEGTPVVFNGRSFSMFPIKVQPVLMNLCARCHCHKEHESAFKLRRVREGYADPQSAGRNARAVARFLNPENPGASEFLKKTVTAHGGAKDPSLSSRNHPAFKNLEYWAYWAMSPEGSLVALVPQVQPKPEIVAVSALRKVEAAPVPAPETGVAPALPKPADSGAMSDPMNPQEPRRLPPVSSSSVEAPTDEQAPKRNPDDPFDPAEFNTLGR